MHAAENVQRGIDQTSAQIQRAADEAPEVAADLVQQVSHLAMRMLLLSSWWLHAPTAGPEARPEAWRNTQGVDTVSEGIEQTRSALREANQPGPPAPYSRQRLTVLDTAPFEGRRAQTGEENQVRAIALLTHTC